MIMQSTKIDVMLILKYFEGYLHRGCIVIDIKRSNMAFMQVKGYLHKGRIVIDIKKGNTAFMQATLE